MFEILTRSGKKLMCVYSLCKNTLKNQIYSYHIYNLDGSILGDIITSGRIFCKWNSDPNFKFLYQKIARQY